MWNNSYRKCKHLSHLTLSPFCTPPPVSTMSSDSRRCTSITAAPSLTPLSHSDTTWYRRGERCASRHSDAFIWLCPNWVSLQAFLSHCKVFQIREVEMLTSLMKVCSVWPLYDVTEQWASGNFILQITAPNWDYTIQRRLIKNHTAVTFKHRGSLISCIVQWVMKPTWYL